MWPESNLPLRGWSTTLAMTIFWYTSQAWPATLVRLCIDTNSSHSAIPRRCSCLTDYQEFLASNLFSQRHSKINPTARSIQIGICINKFCMRSQSVIGLKLHQRYKNQTSFMNVKPSEAWFDVEVLLGLGSGLVRSEIISQKLKQIFYYFIVTQLIFLIGLFWI